MAKKDKAEQAGMQRRGEPQGRQSGVHAHGMQGAEHGHVPMDKTPYANSMWNEKAPEEERLKHAREIVDAIELGRDPWRQSWNEIEDYIMPRISQNHLGYGYGGHKPDPKQGRRIIDATATRAVRILAAGMQGGLTSPARPWFRLRLANDHESESGPERRWLDVVERRMYAALARSNFYQVIHALYTELAAFGSADIYHELDSKRLMRFTNLTCGEFAWACDAAGRVDTVARRVYMTARQLAQRYGEERMSPRTRRLLHQSPEEQVEIVHLVRPRMERKYNALGAMNMPWESLVWEADEAHVFLHEGGYEEFPHLTARWDVSGCELYGRSPGMDVLPDVKMLQEMARSQLLAIHKVVNPPMRVPTSFKQRLNLIPGGLNYVPSGQNESVGPLYQINPDISAVSQKIEDVRSAIREGFFNDLFLMFTSEGRSNVTATEVAERSEEKLLMLGPVIERHQTELLDPLLERTYGMLKRAGMLPVPPMELEGQSLRVEYVSALAQAQRAVTAQAIRSFASDVATLSKIAPSVLDKVDFEQAVDELGSIACVPASLIRSDTEVEALRLAEALKQQEAGFNIAKAVSATLGGSGQSLAKTAGVSSAQTASASGTQTTSASPQSSGDASSTASGPSSSPSSGQASMSE